jgi:hypothetical protein
MDFTIRSPYGEALHFMLNILSSTVLEPPAFFFGSLKSEIVCQSVDQKLQFQNGTQLKTRTVSRLSIRSAYGSHDFNSLWLLKIKTPQATRCGV